MSLILFGLVGSHLVGTAEVAEMLGVSRQRVAQLVQAYADFPRPEAELAAGRVWSRSVVEQWIDTHPQRRAGRPQRGAPAVEELSDDGALVLQHAQQEAERYGHVYLGCEHLVLGLVRTADGLAAKALRHLKVTLKGSREAFVATLASGVLPQVAPAAPSPAPDAPARRRGRGSTAARPYSPRARTAMDLAGQVAKQLGHADVRSEDILLGILQEGNNVGCLMLTAMGLDLHAVRLTVHAAMGFPQPAFAGPDGRPPAARSDEVDHLHEAVIRIEKKVDALEAKLDRVLAAEVAGREQTVADAIRENAAFASGRT